MNIEKRIDRIETQLAKDARRSHDKFQSLWGWVTKEEFVRAIEEADRIHREGREQELAAQVPEQRRSTDALPGVTGDPDFEVAP